MSKRDWPLMFICGHVGCNERVTYRYQTRRDLVESFEQKHYSNGRWLCMRHSRPDELLTPQNRTTRVEWTIEEKPHGRYFNGNAGFVSGPGFKVFAADLEPGTKLIVTTEIVAPETPPPSTTEAIG